MRKLSLMILLASVSVSCASQLDRDLTHNAPEGRAVEESLDLSLINFADITTGDEINLKEYMQKNEKEYVLLTFGSEGCSSCNEKAYLLENYVIGQHSLYEGENGSKFEIVGVNTDIEPYKLTDYLSQYTFIRWSDPSGLRMLEFFMPPGRSFSVPLTVLVVEGGIAFRVLPDEHLSVDEILNKVADYMGTQNSDDAIPKPTPIPDEEIESNDLRLPGPDRLKGVALKDCDGRTLSLSSAFGDVDVGFVQIVNGECGATCSENNKALQHVKSVCENGAANGRSCGVAVLTTSQLKSSLCESEIAYQGGEKFLEVFETMFDWRYIPDLIDMGDYYTYGSFPKMSGPFVLGFNRDGLVVYGKDSSNINGTGTLKLTGLEQWLTDAELSQPVKGLDKELYYEDPLLCARQSSETPEPPRTGGLTPFSKIKGNYKYTIINTWGEFCAGCFEEMRERQKNGQLYDLCESRDDCQMFALGAIDFYEPMNPAEQFTAFCERNVEILKTEDVVIPPIYDPTPQEYEGNLGSFGDSFYSGYLFGKYIQHGSWKLVKQGTVIYDIEGKVITEFPSSSDHENDPALKFMKKLFNME